MGSYDSWPTAKMDPLELWLDDRNPRLSVEGESQEDIRRALLANADVDHLAKSILKIGGFYPHDLPIVVKERGRTIVLEGNRRTAAAQMLANPKLVPAEYRESWPHADSDAQKALRTMKVIIAPNRKIAEPLIARTHAFNARREWAALARMRYAYVALENAGNAAEVADDLGVTAAEVKRLARRYAIYLYVLDLKPAWTPEERVVLGRENSPVTVLVYPFELDEVKSLVGDTFDADGNLVSVVPKRIVDRGLKALARHALIPLEPGNKYRLTTRGGDWVSLSDYFMREHSEWVDAARERLPKPAPKKASTKKKKETKSAKKAAPPKRSRKTVEFFEDFQVPETTSHRIRNITAEITKIDPHKYPMSAVLLMRMLLEIVLVEHLKKKKVWGDFKTKRGERAGLQELCNYCVGARDLFESDELRMALQRFRDGPSPLLGIAAHSDYAVLNGPAVIALKPFVRPIIEGVIEEWGE